MVNSKPGSLNPKGKYLIVNADDYNTNSERNRGIIQAAQEGIVTSVSVIANVPWEHGALEMLRTTFGTRIGIHLNLTRGKPLGCDVFSLVNERGNFFDKATAWGRAFFRKFNQKDVEEEFTAQIKELLNRGINPDHIDGNNHIHVFPQIVQVVAELAHQFNIKKVRIPLEKFTTWGQYFQTHAIKKIFISILARRAQQFFKSRGLAFPDYFAGIQFPDVQHRESLVAFLNNLPVGVTELMCHPGYRNLSGSLFSSEAREKELHCLTHKKIIEQITNSGICLISFGEL